MPRDAAAPATNGSAPPGSLSALQQKSKVRVIPGLAPATNGAASNEANTNGKNKKKGKDGQPNGKASPSVPATPQKSAAADVSAAALTPDDKKKRALMKKLGAIEQLKGDCFAVKYEIIADRLSNRQTRSR